MKHIKNFRIFENYINELTDEQIDWLDEGSVSCIWEFKDGLVNIRKDQDKKRSVFIGDYNNSDPGKLGIPFGLFECDYLVNPRSEGGFGDIDFPKVINGNLIISGEEQWFYLTSGLENLPKIKGDFIYEPENDYAGADIKSLSEKVEGDIIIPGGTTWKSGLEYFNMFVETWSDYDIGDFDSSDYERESSNLWASIGSIREYRGDQIPEEMKDFASGILYYYLSFVSRRSESIKSINPNEDFDFLEFRYFIGIYSNIKNLNTEKFLDALFKISYVSESKAVAHLVLGSIRYNMEKLKFYDFIKDRSNDTIDDDYFVENDKCQYLLIIVYNTKYFMEVFPEIDIYTLLKKYIDLDPAQAAIDLKDSWGAIKKKYPDLKFPEEYSDDADALAGLKDLGF